MESPLRAHKGKGDVDSCSRVDVAQRKRNKGVVRVMILAMLVVAALIHFYFSQNAEISTTTVITVTTTNKQVMETTTTRTINTVSRGKARAGDSEKKFRKWREALRRFRLWKYQRPPAHLPFLSTVIPRESGKNGASSFEQFFDRWKVPHEVVTARTDFDLVTRVAEMLPNFQYVLFTLDMDDSVGIVDGDGDKDTTHTAAAQSRALSFHEVFAPPKRGAGAVVYASEDALFRDEITLDEAHVVVVANTPAGRELINRWAADARRSLDETRKSVLDWDRVEFRLLEDRRYQFYEINYQEKDVMVVKSVPKVGGFATGSRLVLVPEHWRRHNEKSDPIASFWNCTAQEERDLSRDLMEECVEKVESALQPNVRLAAISSCNFQPGLKIYPNLTQWMNARYFSRRNIDYYLHPSEAAEVWKVVFAQEHLPDYDYVMWIDCDAAVVMSDDEDDGDLPPFMDEIFGGEENKDVSLVVSRHFDNPKMSLENVRCSAEDWFPVFKGHPDCNVNSGVFVVRNTTESMVLLDRLVSLMQDEEVNTTMDVEVPHMGQGAFGILLGELYLQSNKTEVPMKVVYADKFNRHIPPSHHSDPNPWNHESFVKTTAWSQRPSFILHPWGLPWDLRADFWKCAYHLTTSGLHNRATTVPSKTLVDSCAERVRDKEKPERRLGIVGNGIRGEFLRSVL